ncbi:MAG: primosomal protein N' [Candidatus Brocadiia bacterium]|nr:primosomal protein N' [Candidatus Brocadiia bacterium]
MASAEPPARGRIAEIALNLPLRRSFDYLIPDALLGRVPIGGRVRVPFGARRNVLGYCVGVKEKSEVPADKLRAILDSLDEEPIFTPRMLELGQWMAHYYHCALGEALNAAIPAAVHAARKSRRVQVARLLASPAEALKLADRIFDTSPAQGKLLRTLAQMGGHAPAAELVRTAGVSRTSLKALEKKGGALSVEGEVVEDEADPLTHVEAELQDPWPLTPEQQHAYQVITNRMTRGRFDVVLLHGITSSGKTEVYLQTIAECARMGRQAIVLVPEISLTPQTVRHFRSRFRRLAVLHSRLTDRERKRQWHAIRAGQADVVIGARSAIFAPVPSLGLLVVDEEHENSFKQDNVPRYHARDVGIMRAKADDALVVLGTATPSLESYHNALTGRYTLVKLPRRIGGHPLPPVEIVDMREEWRTRATTPAPATTTTTAAPETEAKLFRRAVQGSRVISRKLEECMRESLGKGEQVILFINRRGFSPHIYCPRCGYVHKCERCEITMNWHRRLGVVACHYCGHEERPPARCPECGGDSIRYVGIGTERVEETVRALLPGCRTVRMDSDTMKTRTAHEQVLEEFRARRADVLVGTQMIAKGLDFPNVTTVGVVNADVTLHLPDFRSRERSFQLLAQVAGRTGRGEAGGQVVIQTFMPDDPSVRAAAGHDYERFAEQELQMRRRAGYPPYARMARIVCSGPHLEPVERYMLTLGEELERLCRERDDGSAVLGPAPAPMPLIKRRHRYHILLKCPTAAAIHELLDAVRELLGGPSGASVVVDVDPYSML